MILYITVTNTGSSGKGVNLRKRDVNVSIPYIEYLNVSNMPFFINHDLLGTLQAKSKVHPCFSKYLSDYYELRIPCKHDKSVSVLNRVHM